MLRKVSSLCALLNRLIFRKSVKSLLTFNPNTSDLEFGISVWVFFRCLEFRILVLEFHPNFWNSLPLYFNSNTIQIGT